MVGISNQSVPKMAIALLKNGSVIWHPNTHQFTEFHQVTADTLGPLGSPKAPGQPQRVLQEATPFGLHTLRHTPGCHGDLMKKWMDQWISIDIYIYIHIYIYVYSWYGNSRYLEYQLLFKVYLFGNHVFILRLFKFMHTLYFFHRGVESGFHRKKHRHVWCTNHRSKLECLMQKTLGRIGPDTMQAPSIPFLRSLRTMRFNAP
jgi:hypothetical protein